VGSSRAGRMRARKGKEPVRHHHHHIVVRPAVHHRPTFAHRNGLQKAGHPPPAVQDVPTPPPPEEEPPQPPKADPSRQHSEPSHVSAQANTRVETANRPISPLVPLVPGVLLPVANRRIELTTSSEFDSETDDDSSWASEDESAGQKKGTTPDIAREAAMEAARQRDMFTKRPTRSFSNLDRIPRPGLLTSLFRPDLTQSNALFRHSQSAQELVGPRASAHGGMASMQPLLIGSPSLASTSKAAPVSPVAQPVTTQVTMGANGRPAYRLKGRPEGQEEESDSGEEDPEDAVQVSKSVAQRRLEALAGPNRRRQQQQEQDQEQQGPSGLQYHAPPTIPIAFPHPYNLPAPVPQQTPRTTRRKMLANEMSESLRRNLLWERHVTKMANTGVTRSSNNVLNGNRLRPLTAVVSKESGTGDKSGSKSGTEAADREERKRKAIARNRSWADDFHTSGW